MFVTVIARAVDVFLRRICRVWAGKHDTCVKYESTKQVKMAASNTLKAAARTSEAGNRRERNHWGKAEATKEGRQIEIEPI